MKEYGCISHCLSCPECGGVECYRSETEVEGVVEVSCWDCGAVWYEREEEDEEQ